MKSPGALSERTWAIVDALEERRVLVVGGRKLAFALLRGVVEGRLPQDTRTLIASHEWSYMARDAHSCIDELVPSTCSQETVDKVAAVRAYVEALEARLQRYESVLAEKTEPTDG